VIGGKYKVAILFHLKDGAHRFRRTPETGSNGNAADADDSVERFAAL